MLHFETPAAIKAVSALKNLTCGYLLGELDRQAFQCEQRRLLSQLAPLSHTDPAACLLASCFGDIDTVDEAYEAQEA